MIGTPTSEALRSCGRVLAFVGLPSLGSYSFGRTHLLFVPITETIPALYRASPVWLGSIRKSKDVLRRKLDVYSGAEFLYHGHRDLLIVLRFTLMGLRPV